MLPKNSTDFFPKIAEELGLDEDLVSDYIYFVFSKFRKCLSGFKNDSYYFKGLGTFETSISLLQKELKAVKAKNNKYAKMNLNSEVENIMNAMLKQNKSTLRYYEGKLKKILWHKENGDPYKKYSAKQEEDIRRRIELYKKRCQRGSDCTKEVAAVRELSEK